MGGGLMNLIAYGSANIILNGNPSKTFFVAKYNKYTNFGLQRIRLDYRGQRNLDFADETIMEFKIDRHADLLHDTYLVVTMPDIWSSIHWKQSSPQSYIPYEFRWVDNFACALIKSITVRSGGNIISQYSGEYLYCMRERDHTSKYALWDRMSGNVPHFTDPANAHGRQNEYPSAIYDSSSNDTPMIIEPSIRGGKIYIPIETWFSKTGKMALPLVAMQYQETYIEIKFNPISHLYTIRDLKDASGGYLHRQPDPTKDEHSFYRFVNPPENKVAEDYSNKINSWNGDIHLLATYVWLDKQERAVFARDNQSYLIKNVSEVEYKNVNGMRTVDIISKNLVANWMFRFRRTDAKDRNQWFNYSNWPVKDKLPTPAKKAVESLSVPPYLDHIKGPKIYFYSELHEENIKEILIDFSIKMDGKIREDNLPAGVYKWVEKFNRTSGIAEDGIYCYNFGLNNSSYDIQPSGAMNVNKFNKIQFEFETINPPFDPEFNFAVQCDDQSGDIVGVEKNLASMYKYSFDLLVMEERYNVVEVTAGRMALKYAR